MQPGVTSEGTEVRLAEHAFDASKKGKGKEHNKGDLIYSSSTGLGSTTKPTNNTIVPSSTPAMTPPSETLATVTPSQTPLPPHLASEIPTTPHRPRSRPASRDVSPYPRSRPSTPNLPSTPGSSSSKPAAPRRSQRTLAKAPDRPRGPPELEAALAIAIRNLESDIYEWWCANHKPGNPIPTTAYLKSRSPRIRRAAEAVDEADRLLNDAVYGKPKKARVVKKIPISHQRPSSLLGDGSPETAFEHLELNSPGSSPLRPVTSEIVTISESSDVPLPRMKDKKGDTNSGET